MLLKGGAGGGDDEDDEDDEDDGLDDNDDVERPRIRKRFLTPSLNI